MMITGKQITNEEKILFAEAIANSNRCITIGALAKLLSENGVHMKTIQLVQWLKDNDYLSKFGRPRTGDNRFYLKQRTKVNEDESITIIQTPLITGAGQIYFVNKLLENRKNELE